MSPLYLISFIRALSLFSRWLLQVELEHSILLGVCVLFPPAFWLHHPPLPCFANVSIFQYNILRFFHFMLSIQLSHVRSKGIAEKAWFKRDEREWRYGILQLCPCTTLQLQKSPVSGTAVWLCKAKYTEKIISSPAMKRPFCAFSPLSMSTFYFRRSQVSDLTKAMLRADLPEPQTSAGFWCLLRRTSECPSQGVWKRTDEPVLQTRE